MRGFRFGKSIRVGKHTRINVSKRGIGASVGVKGLRVGVGPRGTRVTASIPGTGISASKQVGTTKKPKTPKKQQKTLAPPVPPGPFASPVFPAPGSAIQSSPIPVAPVIVPDTKNALFKAFCQQGWFVVTEELVGVTPLWGLGRKHFVRRADIMGVTGQQTTSSLFGMGGSYSIQIQVPGDLLQADMLPAKKARTILDLLQSHIDNTHHF